MVQAGIRNIGLDPIRLQWLTPLQAEFGLQDDPREWLLTGLNPQTPLVVSLAELSRDTAIAEYGSLYRRDGTGFVFGPAGPPEAYLKANLARSGTGRWSLRVEAGMNGVKVDPGETRWGQQAIFLWGPPREALAQWAAGIGKTHCAPSQTQALSGWSTWYLFGSAVSGKDVLDLADTVSHRPDVFRPDVIQIDDGYSPNKFPEGPAYYARQIAKTGARPGMKLDFNGEADFFTRVRAMAHDGFSYLKIGVHWQSITLKPKETLLQGMRSFYQSVRQAAGSRAYIESCEESPDRAAVGIVQAERTGRAVGRESLASAINDVLRSYFLNGRWYAIDNDNYYMGTDIANVSEISGGWPLVRTWMSMVGLSCGAAITSDPWQWHAFTPYWRNVEVMTPPATEQTEVLDLCTSEEWPRLVGHVRRDWGDATVALLWNPGPKEQAITLDFAKSGMNPRHRYAVWSFWDDQYLGVRKGSWSTPRLQPYASQHLCFTDLDQTPNRPVFIGSNLHIYCGAAEIKRLRSERGAMTIELTDAGARDGDLFVYSRYQPVLKEALGCAVSGVASAGENVWRISLRGRQWGAPQRIALSIMLPVTEQAWFWGLIAVVAASLLFAAWHYLARLRIEHAQALDFERGRIARDLHDEIGANLTHISILSTLAAKTSTEAAISRRHNIEVAGVARQTIQAFDEILWSINPRNDTLQSLSHYICRCAEEIFGPTEVALQFALEDAFPNRTVPPHQRHGMLMAAKECLHNILKHSGATQVRVRCMVKDGAFIVRMTDNGRGFDPQAVSAEARGRRGHGLENMRQRMAGLGGKCQIESQAGSGATITFRLPLD